MGRVVCCKAAGYGSNLEDGFPPFAGPRPLQMICGEFPKSFSNAMSLLDDLVSTKRTSVLQMVRWILKVMEQFVAEHANSFRVSGHFVRRDLRLASSLTHVPGKTHGQSDEKGFNHKSTEICQQNHLRQLLVLVYFTYKSMQIHASEFDKMDLEYRPLLCPME